MYIMYSFIFRSNTYKPSKYAKIKNNTYNTLYMTSIYCNG